MLDMPSSSHGPVFATLAQLAPVAPWQVELAHDRDRATLVWITRGQGTALIDGGRCGIGGHTALFIPARSLFALRVVKGTTGHVLSLPHPSALPVPERSLLYRFRDADAQSELTALMSAGMREMTRAGDALSPAALDAIARLAGVWLPRKAASGAADTAPATAARHLSRLFCQRVADGYRLGLTVDEHAEALGVTGTYLSQICKAETGLTAGALLAERLTHAACQALTETDAPAQDIARDLGFSSASYFTTFLRQHTGRTPVAFRQSPAA